MEEVDVASMIEAERRRYGVVERDRVEEVPVGIVIAARAEKRRVYVANEVDERGYDAKRALSRSRRGKARMRGCERGARMEGYGEQRQSFQQELQARLGMSGTHQLYHAPKLRCSSMCVI